MNRQVKSLLPVIPLLAFLLAGCVSSGDFSSPAQPQTPSPSPTEETAAFEPITLEEWIETFPVECPGYLFSPVESLLDGDIAWPEEGVTLKLGSWKGSLQELADTLGMPLEELEALNPEPRTSSSGDTYYQLVIQEDSYLLPKIPMQKVSLDFPDLDARFKDVYSYPVPQALDEQGAAALATAYHFLLEHHGPHWGIDPSIYNEEGGYSTSTEGALCTTYTQLEEYLACIFTPEYYQTMLGGPLPEGDLKHGLFYQGEDDTINFIMGDAGSYITHCGTLFTQPETQPDGSILFWQLSLYLDEAEFSGYGQGITYTPVEAIASPVRMVPTQSGWRVAELSPSY